MLNILRRFFSPVAVSPIVEKEVTRHTYSSDPIVDHYIHVIEEVRKTLLDAVENKVPCEEILLWSFEHQLKNHDIYLDIQELNDLSNEIFLCSKRDADTLYEWLTDDEINRKLDITKKLVLETDQKPRTILSSNVMIDQYAQAFREDILFDVQQNVQWEKMCGYNVSAWIYRANQYDPESTVASRCLTIPEPLSTTHFINPTKSIQDTSSKRLDMMKVAVNNPQAYENYLYVILRYSGFSAIEQIKQNGMKTLLTDYIKEFSQWVFEIQSEIKEEMHDGHHQDEFAKNEVLETALRPLTDALINAIIFPQLTVVNAHCSVAINQDGEMLIMRRPFRSTEKSMFRLQHVVNRTLNNAKTPEVIEKILTDIMENRLASFGYKFFKPFDIAQDNTEQETK